MSLFYFLATGHLADMEIRYLALGFVRNILYTIQARLTLLP